MLNRKVLPQLFSIQLLARKNHILSITVFGPTMASRMTRVSLVLTVQIAPTRTKHRFMRLSENRSLRMRGQDITVVFLHMVRLEQERVIVW